jgi:type III secretion system (T3SS) SseB-like protein
MTDAAPAPAFEPLNELELLLMGAANATPNMRAAFEAAILDHELFAASPQKLSSGEARPGDPIQLLSVAMPDHTPATALFTAGERAAVFFGDNVSIVSLKGRTLLAMVRRDAVILNPGSAFGVTWTPDAVTALLGLPAERIVARETKVLLGAPAETPDALIEALRRVFGADPAVDAAWLALAHWPETEDHAWYLDVRAADDDRVRVQRLLSRAVEGVDAQDMPVDMVIKAPGGQVGTGIEIVAPRTPVQAGGG